MLRSLSSLALDIITFLFQPAALNTANVMSLNSLLDYFELGRSKTTSRFFMKDDETYFSVPFSLRVSLDCGAPKRPAVNPVDLAIESGVLMCEHPSVK